MSETVSQVTQKRKYMTMSESIQVMKKLLEITGEMHEAGALLIIPENIQMLPDEIAMKYKRSFVGFRAPEVAVMDYSRIGKQSDYYSIVAIFYYCLTGRTISRFQMFRTDIPDISDVICRNKMSENTTKILYRILKKGLAHGLRNRYQSLEQMEEDLEELEKCMEEEKGK